jgi:hypothetical protein
MGDHKIATDLVTTVFLSEAGERLLARRLAGRIGQTAIREALVKGGAKAAAKAGAKAAAQAVGSWLMGVGLAGMALDLYDPLGLANSWDNAKLRDLKKARVDVTQDLFAKMRVCTGDTRFTATAPATATTPTVECIDGTCVTIWDGSEASGSGPSADAKCTRLPPPPRVLTPAMPQPHPAVPQDLSGLGDVVLMHKWAYEHGHATLDNPTHQSLFETALVQRWRAAGEPTPPPPPPPPPLPPPVPLPEPSSLPSPEADAVLTKDGSTGAADAVLTTEDSDGGRIKLLFAVGVGVVLWAVAAKRSRRL